MDHSTDAAAEVFQFGEVDLNDSLISDEFLNDLLSGETATSSSRFVQTTEKDIREAVESCIPVNTLKKAKWAISLLRKWHEEWKVRLDGGLKVFKELEDWTDNELNFCLRFFLSEVRKVNGDLYPPRSLKHLVAMIQWYFNKRLNREFSIFNDKIFHDAREVLDCRMKKGAAQGLLKPKKKAVCISTQDEDEMWTNGAFGSSNPRQLILTLIYHIGLHCSLRASQEHKDLEYGELRTIQAISFNVLVL
jgi:hypothetical protein